jgi:hypothetical protein
MTYMNKLKAQDILDYGYADKNLKHYEEDHLIPVAVGGSPRSPKNLWPELYDGKFGARVKDRLEVFLQHRGFPPLERRSATGRQPSSAMGSSALCLACPRSHMARVATGKPRIRSMLAPSAGRRWNE